MLFDPARHETLARAPWNESAIQAAVRRIGDDAFARFEPERGWPAHPLDEPDTPGQSYWMLYQGAGGVIWALERLRQLHAIDTQIDFTDTVITLAERNRELAEVKRHGPASYLMGDAGLLLLHWGFTHEQAVADRLFSTVEGNVQHPAREALWGSPGSMLAVLQMAEVTAENRWRELFERAVRILWNQMEYEAGIDGWLWVQDLYGKQRRFLGAGHGFAGNVYPVLRGAGLLPPALIEGFLERALRTLQSTAKRDDGLANWEPVVDPEGKMPSRLLVQDCHGAPGIVCRFASVPQASEWNELLLAAGELTWQAGPLVKGPGLCHGTAGNGYALLKLYRRTGDERWLHRARAFAMHAIAQVDAARITYGQGRYSLWTGDPGVALFASSCIASDDRFPSLDVFL